MNNNKFINTRDEIGVTVLDESRIVESDFVDKKVKDDNIFTNNNEASTVNLVNDLDVSVQNKQVEGDAEMLMIPGKISSIENFSQNFETKRNKDGSNTKLKTTVASKSLKVDQKGRSFISSNEKQKISNKKWFSERIIKTLKRKHDTEDRHPQQCDEIMSRNKQIEDLEPYQYQYMFHINNLRKMRGEKEVSECQTFNIGIDMENEEFVDGQKLINAQMVPHISNNQLYLVVYSYQAYSQKTDSGKEIIFEGRTLLRIFKIDQVSGNQPQEIHKKYLMTNIVKWKNIKNAFPGVWNQGKLYYTFIDNDFAEKTTQFKVLEFDFETESENIIAEKSESMPIVDGNILEPILGMLSVYFHIGDDLKFDQDRSKNLSKEEFLDLTYAQFHYRSSEKNKDGDFVSQKYTFRLCNFKKQLNTNTQTSYQAILDDETVEVPIKQFIQFGKYFSCQFKYNPVDDRDELYAYFQDIVIEKGEAILSEPQDASLIEEETHNRMVHYFQHYYSLHSLNSFEELSLGESSYLKDIDKNRIKVGLVHHKIQSHNQINDFMKLADDWNFKLCDHEHEDILDDIDSMNIIFDNINDQIIVSVASGNKIQIKIVMTQSDFTKVQPIKEFVIKDIGIAKAESKIENDDLIIEVKASQTEGIFIQISTKEQEVLLQEIVQFNFEKETFKMSSLCWSGDCIKVPGSNTEKMQNFMCGRVNHNKQFQQVQEFRLIYNPSYWKTPDGKTIRIIDQKSISSSQFLKFLKNSSKMIEIQLFSLNVIVLMEPLLDDYNQLQPIGKSHTSQTDPIITRTVKEDAILTGGEWWSDESDNRIVVKMSEILGKNHNLKSDIAESQYKLYIDENKEQRAIHFQTTLTQQFRDQKKSPWLRSIHLIESISNTQQLFKEMLEKRSIMGVTAKKYLKILQQLTDQICFTQHDRQRTLKQQMRTLINMIQVDFKNLLLDEQNIDIFNPIEQLDGQCLCDFYLKTTEHISKKLEYQKLKAGTLRSSLIEEFIESQQNHTLKMAPDHLLKSSLYQDMSAEGFLQAQMELIGGLFGANPLQRCFMGKEQITTAQLLLDKIFIGSITLEERSILMNVMRYVLECKIEPFPFAIFTKFFELQKNDTPCFFYVLKDQKLENYSDKHQMLSMAEQRNFSSNGTQELKAYIASRDLVVVQKMINQERKTIPIQHAIIDYHQMHLPYKIDQIRAGKDIKYTKIPTISEHLLKVSQKYAKDIQNHPVLKKMNDCLFEQTSKYFNSLLFIQMFGFFLPLVLQIFYQGDSNLVLKCNYSCLSVTIFLQIQEILLMMNLSAYDYWFGDLYHIIDNVLFVVYYYYFSLRYSQPEAQMLPLERIDCALSEDMDPQCIGATDIQLQALLSILNFVLIFGGMSMTLEIIRVQKAVGQQVKLVTAVLQDVVPFFIFFISWVVVFSLLHRVIGNGMGIVVKEDGPDIFWKYLLSTWSMSTGGGKEPDFSAWFKFKNAEENRKLSFFMVTVIWGINIVNAIFVRIILISFLIGIIKKTYDIQMNGEVQNSYEARAEMNQKSSLMLKQLRLLHESDLVVLSAFYNPQVKSAPGIQTVKEDVHNLALKIEIIQDGINSINNKNDQEISSIKRDIKQIHSKMDSQHSELKSLLKQILDK